MSCSPEVSSIPCLGIKPREPLHWQRQWYHDHNWKTIAGLGKSKCRHRKNNTDQALQRCVDFFHLCAYNCRCWPRCSRCRPRGVLTAVVLQYYPIGPGALFETERGSPNIYRSIDIGVMSSAYRSVVPLWACKKCRDERFYLEGMPVLSWIK